MEAVEAHCEDLPFDYEPYADTEGNAYDFGYGMSFGGVIDDDRTHRYTMKRGGE
jgi:bglY